jgi:hypothetical protein
MGQSLGLDCAITCNLLIQHAQELSCVRVCMFASLQGPRRRILVPPRNHLDYTARHIPAGSFKFYGNGCLNPGRICLTGTSFPRLPKSRAHFAQHDGQETSKYLSENVVVEIKKAFTSRIQHK